MPTKRILVFANSHRRQARCVAGREMLPGGMFRNRKFRLGDWIRPVSVIGKGELLRSHYTLQDGQFAAVLDIVEMRLLEPRPDPGQPENWLIDREARWKRVGTVDRAAVARFVETPPDLWLAPDGKTDRISAEAVRRRKHQSSLVLIAPTELRVRAWRKYNQNRAEHEFKSRAVFNYRGVEYALSITDPIFRSAHADMPGLNSGRATEFNLPFGDQCLLCVSLTPPYEGDHYKVVATILELS